MPAASPDIRPLLLDLASARAALRGLLTTLDAAPGTLGDWPWIAFESVTRACLALQDTGLLGGIALDRLLEVIQREPLGRFGSAHSRIELRQAASGALDAVLDAGAALWHEHDRHSPSCEQPRRTG